MKTELEQRRAAFVKNGYEFRNTPVSRGQAANDGANHELYGSRFRDTEFSDAQHPTRCWGEFIDAEADRIGSNPDRRAVVFFERGKIGLAVDCRSTRDCEHLKSVRNVHDPETVTPEE